MNEQYIELKGVRVHNLKNIDLKIGLNKLIVITGVSGSGKSSLAFDTLYAEGQRRYVESLSAYARQFLGRLNKPECDYIKGIPPAIAIEQKVNTSNPRSIFYPNYDAQKLDAVVDDYHVVNLIQNNGDNIIEVVDDNIGKSNNANRITFVKTNSGYEFFGVYKIVKNGTTRLYQRISDNYPIEG